MTSKDSVKNSNSKEEKQSIEELDELPEVEEGEIDFSLMTDEEKDSLILEMQKTEIMETQAAQTTTESEKRKKTIKRKKRKSANNKNIAPGFGWVAIKMGAAMTFSMTFLFLGPLLIFMALIRRFGTAGVYDWFDFLWGAVGLAITIIAIFLGRYIVKD